MSGMDGHVDVSRMRRAEGDLFELAAALVGSGMNWSQALITIMLGNLIVCVPMVLVAHAGTRFGIPFPVLARSSFGDRYINWLIAYSGFLGPVAGIFIADYWLVRRARLSLTDLYAADGLYGRWNGRALAALAAGIVAALVGLVVPPVRVLYDYAWFVGFGVAFAVYAALMRGTPLVDLGAVPLLKTDVPGGGASRS